MPDPTPTTPSGSTPNGDGTPSGSTPNGQTSTQTQTRTPIETLPADIQAYIAEMRKSDEDRRKELADLKKKQDKAEADRKAAEDERLRQQGEHQKLAEQYKGELDQVKPQFEGLQGRYDKLADLLNKQLETTIKDWPAEIKALDPGKGADLEARLSWLDKAKVAVEKLVKTPARPGNAPNPRPADQQNLTPAEQAVRELHATGRYSRF